MLPQSKPLERRSLLQFDKLDRLLTSRSLMKARITKRLYNFLQHRFPNSANMVKVSASARPVGRRLEDVCLDDKVLRHLPTESLSDLSKKGVPDSVTRRQVRGACFSEVTLSSLRNPRLVAVSRDAMQLLDLDPLQANRFEFLDVMSGAVKLPGSRPAAHCYAGYQFGHFSGQLGDGAAKYLGELVNEKNGQRWELQLKGAGPTPYSRNADGRKVLRSTLREFLCSEAMHGLGIPTTRALAVVCSDSRVPRDLQYNGNVIMERCAVACRVAPTFLRFGSFEIFKPQDPFTGFEGPSHGLEGAMLADMVDFAVKEYFPSLWRRYVGRTDSERVGGEEKRENVAFVFNHETSSNKTSATISSTAPTISSSSSSSSSSSHLAPEVRRRMFLDLVLESTRRTASLTAAWQSVGFVHGVLNTDNMSLIGCTLDYGPFAFMDHFDPDHISNGSDDRGRYRYKAQPQICRWNCEMFAEALSSILLPAPSPPSSEEAALSLSEEREFESLLAQWDRELRRTMRGMGRGIEREREGRRGGDEKRGRPLLSFSSAVEDETIPIPDRLIKSAVQVKAIVQCVYDAEYDRVYGQLMRRKLGLEAKMLEKEEEEEKKNDGYDSCDEVKRDETQRDEIKKDEAIVEGLLHVMAETGSDFTNTFRRLHGLLPRVLAREEEENEKEEKNERKKGWTNNAEQVLQSILDLCATPAELSQRAAPKIPPATLMAILTAQKRDPQILRELGLPQEVFNEQLRKMVRSREIAELPLNQQRQANSDLWTPWIQKFLDHLDQKLDLEVTQKQQKKKENRGGGPREHEEGKEGMAEREKSEEEQLKESWRKWQARRERTMKQVNPRFVLRNWIAQRAIEKAEKGDFGEVRRVIAVLADPFSEDDQEDILTAAATAAAVEEAAAAAVAAQNNSEIQNDDVVGGNPDDNGLGTLGGNESVYSLFPPKILEYYNPEQEKQGVTHNPNDDDDDNGHDDEQDPIAKTIEAEAGERETVVEGKGEGKKTGVEDDSLKTISSTTTKGALQSCRLVRQTDDDVQYDSLPPLWAHKICITCSS